MSALDCTTPTGRQWIARQAEVIAECTGWFRCSAVITNDKGHAPIDVLFARDETLVAIGEVKARDMTLQQLRTHGSYLVTMEKLLTGRAIAALLRVPYVLVVGLADAVVYWTVADERGDWQIALHMTQSRTRATCNGGVARRTNAYLRLKEMHVRISGESKGKEPTHGNHSDVTQ